MPIQILSADITVVSERPEGYRCPSHIRRTRRPSPKRVGQAAEMRVRYKRKPVRTATGISPMEGAIELGSSIKVLAAKMAKTAITKMRVSQINQEKRRRAFGVISGLAISEMEFPPDRTLTTRLE